MGTRFDLAGRATLELATADPALGALVAALMDPFHPRPAQGQTPDVLIEALEEAPAVEEIQGLGSDQLVTGVADGRLALMRDGRWCLLPTFSRAAPARFSLAPDFPLGRIFGLAVRPALQLAMLEREAVAIHAAAVELDGAGILIAGWSESGKTETALALMESHGARFLSDKWTVLGADGTLSAFPIDVGVRGWVLPHLPRLDAAIAGRAKAQFAAARVADRLGRPLMRYARGRASAMLADTARHAIALADRAALSPGDVRRAYSQADDPARTVPLRAVALLTTVSAGPVAVAPLDAASLARRLANSGAFERREFRALDERARYAFGRSGPGVVEDVARREERLIAERLAPVETLAVRARFPMDPNPAAAAVAAAL